MQLSPAFVFLSYLRRTTYQSVLSSPPCRLPTGVAAVFHESEVLGRVAFLHVIGKREKQGHGTCRGRPDRQLAHSEMTGFDSTHTWGAGSPMKAAFMRPGIAAVTTA